MGALDKIEKKELKELLSKGWITHDAMWFYHSFNEFGIEKANKINIAAIESMAGIEIQRIKKALGFKEDEKIDSFEKFVGIITDAFDLVKADFMKFKFMIPSKNTIRWEWDKDACFAYQGVKGIGGINQYQCGIIRRIEGWISGLGIEFTMNPEINHCLMHRYGNCSGEFNFSLN